MLLENKKILDWQFYNAANYFGWLSESSEIIKDTISEILQRLKEIEKTYQAIFTSDKRLLERSSIFQKAHNGSTLPWAKQIPKNYQKSKILSIIASNKAITEGHLLRQKAIEQYKKAEVFGTGRNEIQKKESALWPYFFSVVIENAKYPEYFTEKITDCFISKTIPIYYGNPNIGNIFDTQGILTYETTDPAELSSSLYFSKKKAIEKNFEIVLNLENPDDHIYKRILLLKK